MEIIALTKGYFAIIDKEDFELVSQYRWYARISSKKQQCGKVYAAAYIGEKFVYMHRLITGASANQLVNHRSPNTLDNRRANLELCSMKENSQYRRKMNRKGSSKYVGVWRHPNGRWHAYIYTNTSPTHPHGVKKFLGSFNTEEEAATARDQATLEQFGNFALPNLLANQQVTPDRCKTKTRPVNAVRVTDGIVFNYQSIQAAARSLGVNPGAICSCAKGQCKTAYGFHWNYDDSSILQTSCDSGASGSGA